MIKYIYLSVNNDTIVDRKIGRKFNLSTYHITEYISRDIYQKKYKYKKARQIVCEIDHDKEDFYYDDMFRTIVYESTFSLEEMLSLSSTKQREKILELLNISSKKLDELIPGIRETIDHSIDSFKVGEYKNIWLFKKRRITGIGTAKLICELTVSEFILTLTVENKEGREIYRKVLFKDESDPYLSYNEKFKGLKIDDENILVLDKYDCISFKVSLSDIEDI